MAKLPTMEEFVEQVATFLVANDCVHVVRCKYCKHFTEGMAIGMCKRNPEKPIIPMPYNGYCCFGERKDHD